MASRRTWSRRALAAPLALAAMLGALPAGAQPSAAPVTVFAAASLKNAMDDAIAAFTARTHLPARASYGASSALARQIEQGAPADVFVSADIDWMDYLARKNLIATESRTDLLSNHLALIAPADSKIRLRIGPGMPLAAALGAGRLAVAGPDVPAGRYAQASLTALGVWPSVQGKLARAESVRAALAFVARGETPLGIVYDTDAKVEPKVRIVGLFPDSTHPPIIYPAAPVRASRNPNAPAFMRFLRGRDAAAIFHRYGFQTVSSR
ncbi:MAG: molybdate transporter substrate-binding protein [Caulobacteraceae bacterium]|nr:molybdate transporter substrate-binding protein [Caulobacteraceae bacterium]